jgi:phosphopantetheine--protein transferase-like protein
MIDVGIEIKEIEEIENFPLEKLKVFLCPEEILHGKPQNYAGKIAAKTAFLKLAKENFSSDDFKKITVDKKPSGRPFIKITDSELKQRVSGYAYSVSISHSVNMAVALCVFYNKKNGI